MHECRYAGETFVPLIIQEEGKKSGEKCLQNSSTVFPNPLGNFFSSGFNVGDFLSIDWETEKDAGDITRDDRTNCTRMGALFPSEVARVPNRDDPDFLCTGEARKTEVPFRGLSGLEFGKEKPIGTGHVRPVR